MENAADRIVHQTNLAGAKHPCSQISAKAARAIRKEYVAHQKARRAQGFARVQRGFLDELTKRFSVSKHIVCDIVTGRTWKTLNEGQAFTRISVAPLKKRLTDLNNQTKIDRKTIQKALHARRPKVNGRTFPSFEEVARLLHYRPEDGRILLKIDRQNARAGDYADNLIVNGYRVVNVLGRRFMAHRVAWLLYRGEWPASLIDHRDGDKINNRMDNLREATHSQNNANVGPKSNNRSGFRGVHFDSKVGLYKSRIRMFGRTVNLGWFANPTDAHAAFADAAIWVHGEFAVPRQVKRELEAA